MNLIHRHTSLIVILTGVLILVFLGAVLRYTFREPPYITAAYHGAKYLVQHQNTDGRFVYEYNAIEQRTSTSYNILRHAGAAYALFESYERFHDEHFLSTGERAVEYLLSQSIPCPKATTTQCIVENDEIKIGGNALAILALAKHSHITGSSKYIDEAQAFAEYILTTQQDSGEFRNHKISATGDLDNGFVSEYYPGEAIFALVRLYEIDPNPRWIAAATSAAKWLINVRDSAVADADLSHDHWLLYGLAALYAFDQNPIYVAHTKRLVDAIIAAQHKERKGDEISWNGGYYTPPRSTPAATRSEGLAAAYQLFTVTNDIVYRTRTYDALSQGIAFALRTQLNQKRMNEMHADKNALGGFCESLVGCTIRIDYVQHNISALLAFAHINQNTPITKQDTP